jgi:hypothetical protein
MTATRTVYGRPSWRLRSQRVEAFVTRTGGQLAPVTFDLGRGRKVQPFAIAPWWNEKLGRDQPAMLRVLRGDFFCMPFGGNDKPYRGERHPPHGETANRNWRLESINGPSLHLALRSKTRAGRIDKHITLHASGTSIHCRHVITGMSGSMNFGHHATLAFAGEGLIATSRFSRGQVYVNPMEDPAAGGYSILKPAAHFKSLASVPTITGDKADLSRFPARRGYEDLVQVFADPKLSRAWTAVTFPKQGYVWFALRDPRVLTGTILWISNGGRHYAPWNGRHFNVMGLEDVTSYFHEGIASSAKANPATRAGYQTALRLAPDKPLVVDYTMAVAPVPRTFGHVRSIVVDGGIARVTDRKGRVVSVRVAESGGGR